MHAEHSPITEWQVLVHLMPDETVKGMLRFVEGKPRLTLESGEVIDSETEDVTYSVEHEIIVGDKGESVFRELKNRVRIVLKPYSVRDLPYTPHLASVEEDMYPQSTRGWFGRYMMAPTESLYSFEELPFIYVVQEIKNQEQFWLTILDRNSGDLFESHSIKLFEKPILHMLTDMEYRYQRIKAVWDIRKLKKQALQILDSPPPSWEQLTYLARGVSIQELKVKDTMGKSLDPLVPSSIPHEQREQIKAFLALTLSITSIPDDDPVEYLEQYYGTMLLRNLLSIHLRILAQGSNLPDYVALLFSAALGKIEGKKIYEGPRLGVIRGFVSALLKPPYYKHYWEELTSHIESFTKSKKLTIELPVTKSQAKKSRKSWLSRIELMMAGTKMSLQVRYHSVGLVQLVYFGSAHTWTHQHLAWFAKTRDVTNTTFVRPRFFQVMVMPPKTAEQVKRAMGRISEIEWSYRKVNYHLYNADSKEWRIDIPKILSSLGSKYSIRSLIRNFQISTENNIHKLTFEEAQVIDLLRSGLYLDTFKAYIERSDISYSINHLIEILKQLKSKRIVDISYETTDALDELNTPYITVAESTPENICSIVRAFLLHTPSSYVFLEQGARRSYIISRLPKIAAYDLIRSLPQDDESNGLKIRCSEVFGYRAYEHNLLQRLLKKDGSWESNASELLSQTR